MSNFPGVVSRVAEAVSRRKISLRYYQSEVKQQVLAEWVAGKQAVMAVMPTGAGKTVLFTDMISDHRGAAVLIAHRQELVTQISLTLNMFGVRHRLICPDPVRKLIIARHLREQQISYHDPSAPVGVGGVDTLVRASKRRELDSWRQSVTLGVIDEAHHVLEDNKWGRAVCEFPAAGRWLLVTATPERPDGRGLGRHTHGLADALVVGPGMRELIDDGYLCPYQIWTVPHHVDYDSVAVGSSGEYVQAKLVAAEDTDGALIGNIVHTYQQRTPGKRAICFVSSVKRAEEVAEAFRVAGVPAVAVDGKSSDEERERATADLAAGRVLVIVNCDLIGEGVDVPAVEVVIMGTRTASFVRYTQWFGRMLRLALTDAERAGYDQLDSAGRRARIAGSSKPFGVLIDHGGNVPLHNGPPDMRHAPWTLDARERKAGPSDAIPYRVCAGVLQLTDPAMSWLEARRLGMTDADLLATGLALPAALPCATPYPAVYRACPCCGYVQVPAARRTPEQVDGDLQLLDDDALQALAANVRAARESDGDMWERLAATGLSPDKIGANLKHHRARGAALDALAVAMERWGGWRLAAGDTDDQMQRRFFLSFGMDVLSAQALPRADAEKLTQRIDDTANRAQY